VTVWSLVFALYFTDGQGASGVFAQLICGLSRSVWRKPMDQVECVVVGAGVISLAVARALALQGREVLVLEAANAFGTAKQWGSDSN